MAYYNKDGVEIKHFEDDDEFAEFFNNTQTIIVKAACPADTETSGTDK